MLTSSGGSLNADRGEGGVKFAKILLTSYMNAPILIIRKYRQILSDWLGS